MNYWLIVFLLNSSGDFAGKIEQGPFKSESQCIQASKQTKTDREAKLEFHCVSNDHYTGKKPDAKTWLDFPRK